MVPCRGCTQLQYSLWGSGGVVRTGVVLSLYVVYMCSHILVKGRLRQTCAIIVSIKYFSQIRINIFGKTMSRV